MSLYSGLGAPSAHSDVLSASPDNTDSKRALVEEIKRRGRATVGSKSYPDADALYGKGIEVLSSLLAEEGDSAKKDLAIFYSNRSLVRLQMGKVTEALEDADEAVKFDPTYVKAHWRQGQAFTACGHSSNAVKSFEKALELEPENKALKNEVQAAKERREQEEKLLAESAAAAADESADNDGDAVMKDAPKTKSEPSTKAAPKTKTSSSTKVEDKEDESVFTKSDHVRGYKIRSDGKKTSYFDREISEETKALIGDIAPKKIDPNNPAGDDFAPKPLPVAEGASAWNKAGTWEERDVSAWAEETLKAALLTAEYILPDGSPSPGARGVVSKVSKFNGHASYATVRGKKRYIYEFGVTVNWVLTLGDDHTKTCHGKMTFPDIDGTVEMGEGYDMTDYHVDGSSPAGTGPLLDRFVRDSGLRDSIHKVIDDWVRLFRATY
jgi:tetratricopeptide (TPR) repeat protein